MNVLLTDDHQLVLDGLNQILSEIDGVHVVGFANNGKKALEVIDTLRVDLVLMDIDMPVMNGLEATQIIKKDHPQIKVIVLSMHDEVAIIQKVIKLGADGYLLKNSDKHEFIEAIEKVRSGQKYFSADVTLALTNQNEIQSNSSTANLASLTERETEILKLISEGYSNKEIGETLFISHRTVDTHRTNLMKKLEVNNVAGLVKIAIKSGLAD